MNNQLVILINANSSLGRKVLSVPAMRKGIKGTWQYVFSGKMKTLPVLLVDFIETDIDYLRRSYDDNLGHIVLKDESGKLWECTYQIIR